MLSRGDVDGWSKEQQRKEALAAGEEPAADEKEEWSDDSEDEAEPAATSAATGKVVLLEAAGKGLEDVSVLSHYRALERLDLSSNKLAGLGSIATLGGSMRSLSLAQNPLSSADGVERLGLLTTLDLCECGLAELPALNGLPELVTLLLSGNALTALPVVAAAGEETGLRELRIDRNQLTTAGPAVSTATCTPPASRLRFMGLF